MVENAIGIHDRIPQEYWNEINLVSKSNVEKEKRGIAAPKGSDCNTTHVDERKTIPL
jgi:hypothetical protein